MKIKIILVFGAIAIYGWFLWIHRTRIDYEGSHTWLVRQVQPIQVEIPNIIHQTYMKKDRIPLKVGQNISKYAEGYQRNVYDDAEIENYLEKHFHEKVLQAFRGLKRGAHKADLFRYCVLYMEGGIYMDIKTELIRPIKYMFPDGKVTTVVSRKPSEIYQGLIAAPAGQPIFLALIDGVLKSGISPPYNLFILDFMRYIKKDCDINSNSNVAKANVSTACKKHKYNLFQEVCTTSAKDCEDGLDRYGVCCNIFENGVRAVKTRYADFPW